MQELGTFFPDNGKQVFLKWKIFPHDFVHAICMKEYRSTYEPFINKTSILGFFFLSPTYLCDIWFLFAIFSTMNSMWIFLFFGEHFYVLFYWTLTMICFSRKIFRCWRTWLWIFDRSSLSGAIRFELFRIARGKKKKIPLVNRANNWWNLAGKKIFPNLEIILLATSKII